jgi:transposase
MEIRTKAVILYEEKIYSAAEISRMYNISERTLRRWKSRHKHNGIKGLKPIKTGPKESKHSIGIKVEQRIVALKQKYPHWGARRLKHQFIIPAHFNTVHNVIKKNGLLIRVKAKPQACKRFQRKHFGI